ncbi:hypothetical protein [Aeromicrobium sp.]|uniref:hypothetical protein n=1 Tax=Aeromicrobium sp. TaxID=1871063 RepID=UPI004034C3A1
MLRGAVSVRPIFRRRASVVRDLARTHVILLVADLHVRVVDAATGELLRDLEINPERDYQPQK